MNSVKIHVHEPAICEVCDAVLVHRRWIFGGILHEADRPSSWKDVHRTVCPACRQQPDPQPMGFLYLSGSFVAKHHAEILVLLASEAGLEAQDAPLARILKLDEVDEDWLAVSTTTQQLALRLGQALSRVYGGELDSHYSPKTDSTRIAWHREI